MVATSDVLAKCLVATALYCFIPDVQAVATKTAQSNPPPVAINRLPSRLHGPSFDEALIPLLGRYCIAAAHRTAQLVVLNHSVLRADDEMQSANIPIFGTSTIVRRSGFLSFQRSYSRYFFLSTVHLSLQLLRQSQLLQHSCSV